MSYAICIYNLPIGQWRISTIYETYISFPKFIFLLSYGKQIDENTAKTIAQNLMSAKTALQANQVSITFKLYYKSVSADSSTVYYYVFNTSPTKGFVIVAGDDNVTPILGYSTESSFDTTSMSHNAVKWLEGYKNQIRNIVVNKIQANTTIQNKWHTLLNPSKPLQQILGITGVSQLIQTTWNQSPYYNSLCPIDSGQGTQTGCVATAMAQVMKYWNYPSQGMGIHEYSESPFGNIEANFGSTTYQWGSMPNSLNFLSSSTEINAIATLMYDAGVSVNMQYGVNESTAYVILAGSPTLYTAQYALKKFFGYSNNLRGVQQSNYSSYLNEWVDTLENELNAGRPIIYAGFGSTGGHCFVLDGYDADNFFHVNWGWQGSDDGYYQIGALNPIGFLGIGAGNGMYNNNNQAILGIQPPASQQNYNLQLYKTLTPVDSSVNYGQAFSVSTNIINDGSNTFTGDYGALIFDASFNLIDSVQIKYGESLQSGFIYTNDLTFSTTGKLNMLPGKYYVGIYYRPVGGDWIDVGYTNYNNISEIDVVNNNSIALNSAIAVTPYNLIQGQSIGVNLNIVNNSPTTFFGYYQTNLFNLDGTLAQTIGTVTESNGLPSGDTYVSPYLNFSSSAITVSPGQYLLAVSYLPTNGDWLLVGTNGNSFQNPVKVNIQAPPILADKYEVNDTTTTAASLPVIFSNDSANVNTTGSNFHTGNDLDYYKVILPKGYNYTINARLDDSYSSNNGNTYTVDARFAYSTNGITWSDYYDDVMPNNIIANGGDTVYFFVTHYFIGSTGTYLLNMNIYRNGEPVTWLGNTSSDWIIANNWSTGSVPSANDDIIINTGTPFSPIINNGTIGLCKSIHVNNTSALTIKTGGNLIISGH